MIALVAVTLGACSAPARVSRIGTAPLPPAPVNAPVALPTAAPASTPERPTPENFAVPHSGPIAVLLPLTGALAAPAGALRDGIIGAYFDQPYAQGVQVYDSGADGLLEAYARARADDAALIIGPLTKDDASLLAAQTPRIPVIALNYLDAAAPLPADFYQFGLAPEDEARAAADDAAARGLRNAVALVPEGDWGARVLDAFAERLQQWQGQVVAAARYRPGVSDQSKLVAQLMGGGAAQERHRDLLAVLGERVEFDAQRRGDIEFVFMPARAADARMLLPQLRFHGAVGLPHYATALVYDGQIDRELVTLRFCDMPLMIAAANTAPGQQRAALQGLPQTAQALRLAALGADAYRLASARLEHRLQAGSVIDGLSGTLEWTGNSAIPRKLDCVQIQREGLRALP